MEGAMNVSEIMTANVIQVHPDTPIAEAIWLMLKHQISGLPVVETNGDLAGIVTEGDFLRRSELGTQPQRSRWLQFLIGPGKLAQEYVHTRGRKVREVMTREVQTVTEVTPLSEAVELMEKRHVKRLPVLRGRQLVGIVSRANFLRGLASVAREIQAQAPNDAAIREKIRAELDSQRWAFSGAIDVTVRDGVVDLWGSIIEERTRQALIVAAENVPGVSAVRDHLVWIEPYSGVAVVPEEEQSATAYAS
jgi:CBS domain-containing protein